MKPITKYLIHIKLSAVPHYEHEKCFCEFYEETEIFTSKQEAIDYFLTLKKNEKWADCFIQAAKIEEIICQTLNEYNFS